MAFYRISAILYVAFFLTILFCSQNKISYKTACIIGKDTLSYATISSLAPDSISDKEKNIRVALEMVLLKKNDICFQKDNSGTDKRLFSDLANQLTLQTGVAWSLAASKNVYAAARVIKCYSGINSSASVLVQFLDSAFSKNMCQDPILVQAVLQRNAQLTKLGKITSQKDFESVLVLLLHVSPMTAAVISEFLYSEEKEQLQVTKVAGKIKGLVAGDSVKNHKVVTAVTAKEAPMVDPVKALQIRTRESIADSIKKHIPNIEALYKKELKSHPFLQGTVWVTFIILPSGSVATTQIRSSSVSEKGFIDPFSVYIKKIHFKSIPENLGTMTFEFPFEFAPEN